MAKNKDEFPIWDVLYVIEKVGNGILRGIAEANANHAYRMGNQQEARRQKALQKIIEGFDDMVEAEYEDYKDRQRTLYLDDGEYYLEE